MSIKPISKLQLEKSLLQLGKVHILYRIIEYFIATSSHLFVALFSTGDLERLAKEVSTMLSFKHENVMSLIGVCIDGEMPLLIMPFMSNGSVLDFVRKNKQKMLLFEGCTNEEVGSN